ncbi:hypothetical protein R6Z07F_016751 [Ovis aries]
MVATWFSATVARIPIQDCKETVEFRYRGRVELESSSAVGGTQGPWATAGPGGERSARLGAPGGPAAVQGRAGPARGAAGLESGRIPAAHHAPGGPRPSPAPPGVPARTPRPVLAGVALTGFSSLAGPAPAPPRNRAPRRGGPSPVPRRRQKTHLGKYVFGR